MRRQCRGLEVPTRLRAFRQTEDYPAGGRMGHFEIVPREAMTPERFQELANQIVLKPAGG